MIKYLNIFFLTSLIVVLLILNVRALYCFGGVSVCLLLFLYSVSMSYRNPQWAKEFCMVSGMFFLIVVFNYFLALERTGKISPIISGVIALFLLLVVSLIGFFLMIKLIEPTEELLKNADFKKVWIKLVPVLKMPFLFCMVNSFLLFGAYFGAAFRDPAFFQVSVSRFIYFGYSMYLLVFFIYLSKIDDRLLLKFKRVTLTCRELLQIRVVIIAYLILYFLVGGFGELFRKDWLLFAGNGVVSVVYLLSILKLLGLKEQNQLRDKGNELVVGSIDSIVSLNFKFTMTNAIISFAIIVIFFIYQIFHMHSTR